MAILVKKSLVPKPVETKYMIVRMSLLFLFVLIYPMVISIYVFTPLFIGTMAYILLEGLYKEKYFAIFTAAVYFINFEVNLSLPLFFIIILSLLFYTLFYSSLIEMKRCKYCKAILTVLAINIMYALGLYIYDFIFETNSIFFDDMLLYSLLADIFLVILL